MNRASTVLLLGLAWTSGVTHGLAPDGRTPQMWA
jgi:hypothetical protein